MMYDIGATPCVRAEQSYGGLATGSSELGVWARLSRVKGLVQFSLCVTNVKLLPVTAQNNALSGCQIKEGLGQKCPLEVTHLLNFALIPPILLLLFIY